MSKKLYLVRPVSDKAGLIRDWTPELRPLRNGPHSQDACTA